MEVQVDILGKKCSSYQEYGECDKVFHGIGLELMVRIYVYNIWINMSLQLLTLKFVAVLMLILRVLINYQNCQKNTHDYFFEYRKAPKCHSWHYL